MHAIGEDWQSELEGLPAWAINAACRWWMSHENKERRKKPIAGDIGEKARAYIARVDLARLALLRFDPEIAVLTYQGGPAGSDTVRDAIEAARDGK